MRTAGFGCLLIITAMVLLFGIVVIPVLPPLAEDANVDSYLQSLLCPTGSTVERDIYQTTDRDGTGYSMNVYCNLQGDRQDVTDKWMLYGLVGFVAPFLIGLFMLIGGIISRTRRAFQDPLAGLPINVTTSGSGTAGMTVVRRGLSSSSSPVDGLEGVDLRDNILRVGGTEIDLGAMQKMTTQAFNQMGASSQTSPQDSRNLVKQLKQLQEAKAAGLISEIEFERLRQEILDKWTDG